MELYPVVDRRYPTKVTNKLKDLLLNFTINCLMEQPPAVIPYAAQYFETLEEKQKQINAEIEAEEVYEEAEAEDFFPSDMAMYSRGRGQVVYSEPYNPEKDDDDEEDDIVYEKTKEQRDILYNVVIKCLLFRSLDSEQIQRVIDVMVPREVVPGDYVIKQYDDGDYFYIIEFGHYDVYIAPEKGEEPNYIFTYKDEGSFGELALMYNMPRAATIVAKTEGRLWAMDRQTFRRIVLKAAFKKRKMYEELISNVSILQELTNYERMNLADALVPKSFEAGDIIMNQGDEADGMYFIEKGTVTVTIYDQKKNISKLLCQLDQGDYFGELALLTSKPRAATVTAHTEIKLAFLDVEAFERILGPCMDIMKRNVDYYKVRASQVLEMDLTS